MKGIIYIGSSDTNIKTLVVDDNIVNNRYIINKDNYIFEIIINNNTCICKRLDLNKGWEIELLIEANIKNNYYDSNIIPVFFINLEKDKDRLIFIRNILNNIFNNKYVYRIEGVKHNIGLEGCRLAHINAHIAAINKGFNYYIITEDDIKPLIDTENINKYIKKSILFKPDLVLFEQGEKLEEKIQLKKINDNMYRIEGGGNNAGCYLCSKKFGIELIKHWIKSTGKHIDHSWQELWKSNNVYFHRPQLFQQREGYSNQNDVYYRNTIKPFDWELYEKKQLRIEGYSNQKDVYYRNTKMFECRLYEKNKKKSYFINNILLILLNIYKSNNLNIFLVVLIIILFIIRKKQI